MSDRSAIEWTGPTWNPVTGCDRVSEGCDRCYALTLAKRLKAMGNPRYQVDGDPRTSGPGFGITLHEDKLLEPLSWRKPVPVFVNSMSDLFHKAVPNEFIARVFAVMSQVPRHIFQVLTKRPGRMASLVGRTKFIEQVQVAAEALHHDTDEMYVQRGSWPLENVWLGTSVENQKWADVRIPKLLETPAAVRFLSCEPLLGPVDLDRAWPRTVHSAAFIHQLDWIIVGGESGHGFRPMDPAWPRALRDQCIHADVPFFFKQVGGRTPKAGGRLLDGREWNEFPASTPPSVLAELPT